MRAARRPAAVSAARTWPAWLAWPAWVIWLALAWLALAWLALHTA